MQSRLSPLQFMIAMLTFESVTRLYNEVPAMSDANNCICASFQMEGLFIQLHVVFESHTNLVEYFDKNLLS